MSNTVTRTYSHYSREAMLLLAKLIRSARIERKLTAQALAGRAGISRSLLQRIEKGDLRCEIGTVFEVATLVGIKLFDTGETSLAKQLKQTEEKLALLPKAVRPKTKEAHDDF